MPGALLAEEGAVAVVPEKVSVAGRVVDLGQQHHTAPARAPPRAARASAVVNTAAGAASRGG